MMLTPVMSSSGPASAPTRRGSSPLADQASEFMRYRVTGPYQLEDNPQLAGGPRHVPTTLQDLRPSAVSRGQLPVQIESALSEHEQVREAVAVAVGKPGFPVRLVLYYVLQEKSNLDQSELMEFLRKKLPEYMLPTHVMELEILPRLPMTDAWNSE